MDDDALLRSESLSADGETGPEVTTAAETLADRDASASASPRGDRRVRLDTMDDPECPFVNRYDGRCSEHLTMGGLGYAYRYCFAEFAACPVYAELMAERAEGVAAAAGTAGGDTPEPTGGAARPRRVEVTVNRQVLQRAVRVA
ncbi:MAG: hypothetical protein ACK4PI_09075 [Tepidisphaerales bacterium]